MVFKMNLKADQRTDMVPNFSFMNASPLAFMIPQHDDENSLSSASRSTLFHSKTRNARCPAEICRENKTEIRCFKEIVFRVNCLVDGTVYIRTVRLFKLCTFDSLLAGLGRNIVYSAVHVALPYTANIYDQITMEF